MLTQAKVMFLFDVDNTLIDNDRFAADLSARLAQDFGAAGHDHYWALYAKLRDELGYADYLATLQAFRAGRDDNPHLLQMSAFLIDYPFNERLYPRALSALEHLRALGTTAILSDGDIVYQPRKIQRSGIWNAVDGRVLITLHKERRLELVQRQFPADHYVMIEDKPQLLATMKQVLGAKLTTVFVRQGHYAAESDRIAINPMPDMTVEHIGDLCDLAMPQFHDLAAEGLANAARQGRSRNTFKESP